MLAGWEVRWFCAGEPDPGSVALFQKFDWRDIGEREDVYMRLPGVANLGMKHREGRLEAKGRRLVVPNVQLAPGVVGNLEQWIKWTCHGAELKPFFESVVGDKALGIRVQKQRVQRKFHLGDTNEEVAFDQRLDRGLYLELARIKIQDQRWWSLGIEAFPDDSEVPEQVAKLVLEILGGTTVKLPVEWSQSYPAWLTQFMADGS